eukprot:PLAT4396.2.p1 GENE.PLAT4396.2~~PLAT4396.2.p1  ORF type:complete len:940 (+),score=306.27 PLAT4396.2:356-2821(+)
MDEVADVAERCRLLVDAFASRAKAHVATIIAEAKMDADKRTIAPVDVGGIAGGSKYIHDGIFFKFTELLKLYPDYEAAAKVAAHERKGYAHVLRAGVEGLHCGLVVQLDYLGFRCLASSLLPVSSSTLVYGSADAARTTFVSDAEANAAMALLGERLNLEPHFVGSGSYRRLMFGPADIEVHRGRDDHLYVLDTARLMPPHPPHRGLRGSHLYRLMRGEAVQGSPVSLSSDAFTMFGRDNATEHNQRVRAAVRQLLVDGLHACADKLDNRSGWQPLTFSYITMVMRRCGLNMFMLAQVRQQAVKPDTRRTLLSFMVARCFKKLLRRALRTAVEAGRTSPRTLCHVLYRGVHMLLGEGSKRFWSTQLRRMLLHKYGAEMLSEEESADDIDLRSKVSTPFAMVDFALRKCGATLSEEAASMLIHAAASWPGKAVALPAGAITSVLPCARFDGYLRRPIYACEELFHIFKHFCSSRPDVLPVAIDLQLRLARALYGRMNFEYVQIAADCASVLLELGQGPRAASIMAPIVDAHGLRSQELLGLLPVLGNSLSKQGRYGEACRYFQAMVDSYRGIIGPEKQLVTAHSQLACYSYMQGSDDNIQHAMRVFHRGYTLCQDMGWTSQHCCLRLLQLAGQMVTQLTPDGAAGEALLMHLLRLDSMCDAALPRESVVAAMIVFTMSRQLNASGDMWSARDWADRAVAMLDAALPGLTQLPAAVVLSYRSMLYRRMGLQEQMLADAQAAVAIFDAELNRIAGRLPQLQTLIYFPSVYGELAVMQAARGDAAAGMETLTRYAMRSRQLLLRTHRPPLPAQRLCHAHLAVRHG